MDPRALPNYANAVSTTGSPFAFNNCGSGTSHCEYLMVTMNGFDMHASAPVVVVPSTETLSISTPQGDAALNQFNAQLKTILSQDTPTVTLTVKRRLLNSANAWSTSNFTMIVSLN